MQQQIIDILVKHARLGVDAAEVTVASDLYAQGLTSLTTVHVMLALEEAFDVEFPDHLLGRKTFASVQSIADAIVEIRGE